MQNNTPLPTPAVADYDKKGYDYTQYWQDKDIARKYEDQAERIAIARFLKHIPAGGTFLDLGAGFGRLYDSYAHHFDTVIISDYSIENLKKASKNYESRIINQGQDTTHLPNTYFVALNAYNLPFRDESFEAMQTIRMMHHIENATAVVSEISRVMKTKGYLIFEYANKRHFVAILRFVFDRLRLTKRKGKINPFRREPEDQSDLFYNFHPRQIESTIRNRQLNIRRVLSVSNLRSGFLKKIFPIPVMVFLEKILQYIFSPLRFAPSIFILAQKGTGKLKISRTKEQEHLTAILQCPACQSQLLLFAQTHIICNGCHKSYPIIDGIYDLRV